MVSYDRDRAGSIKEGDHAVGGRGQTQKRPAYDHVRARSRHRLGLLQGADVPVAQTVVDEDEQFVHLSDVS